jgi:hypothetical protein
MDEALTNPDAAVEGFKARYPDAQNCRVLLIPGLFTEYYPGYFDKNVEWLKEKLGFDVKVVSMHGPALARMRVYG